MGLPPAPLLLGLGLVVGAAAAGTTAVDLVEIFKGGPSTNPWSKGQFACYRIPSLVRSAGTLLAFGSERLSSGHGCNDEADTNLVLRRSTDGGATWSPMQLVVPAVPAGSSVANSISTAPWSMVDDATGDVLVFFNGNSTRCNPPFPSPPLSLAPLAPLGGARALPGEKGYNLRSLPPVLSPVLATVGLRLHPSPPHHHCGFLSLPVSGSVSDPAQLQFTSLSPVLTSPVLS